MAEEAQASASAFFAKKKKGKKTFKAFNANKIDASEIPSPAFEVPANAAASGLVSVSTNVLDDSNIIATGGGEGDVWEDSLSPQHSQPQQRIATQSQASELIDMRALEEKRRGEDNVKERLRIEETKSMLQRAKEGMEQQAKKLEEERLAKERKAAERAATMGGGATSSSSGVAGGKWVPSVKRNLASSAGASSAGGFSSRFGGMGLGGSSSITGQKKLNTRDEEMFPDLAMADKILEHKEKTENRPKYVLPKKNPKPVWAKPPTSSTDAVPAVPDAVKVEANSVIFEPSITAEQPPAAPTTTVAVVSENPAVVSTATVPETPSTTSANASSSLATKVVKKKKKKDVSTFKTGGD